MAQTWIDRGHKKRRVLRICGAAPSSYYYKPTAEQQKRKAVGRPIPGYSLDKDGKRVPDAKIKGCIRRILAGEEAVYGYRKITCVLRDRYRLKINKKKVYRLCKELDLLMPQREVKNKVPRRVANNRVVQAPNELWQIDIKYGYVAGLRRHFYLASILDVCDRQIVAHYKGRVCTAADIVRLVHTALLKRNALAQGRLVIRTDNGPQFCSKAFHEFCEAMGVEHERTPNRTPNKNAFIESFHSVLERECYQRNLFETYEQAYAAVDRYIDFYNKRRLHGSLGDLAPAVYHQKWLTGEITPRKIAL